MVDRTERCVLIGAVGLVKGETRNIGQTLLEICDELEPLIHSSGFIIEAPFKTLNTIISFVDEKDMEPETGALNAVTHELPLNVYASRNDLASLSKADLKKSLLLLVLRGLIHTGTAYGLPTDTLEESQTK